MGKEIFRSFKYNRSKIPTPTLKKPVISSSANHKSYTTNLTRNIISSKLENEDITEIQNTSEILKYILYPLLSNTPKIEYQCSGHNYTPLFDNIGH